MKQLLITTALISTLIFSVENSFAAAPSSPHGSVTFQVFYDELTPYGSWVTYGNYGYVWIPSMGGSFVPYSTSGHWVYTDYGWTWASGYSWGWAPYHYGRWLYDDFYGWMWVPGYEWAPSWVVWGTYDDYYGWAPIPPGVTVIAGYRPPPHYWLFCPAHNIVSVDVHRYVVTRGIPREHVTVIDNYSQSNYHYGPRREAVEKASGKPVTRVAVVERNAPAPTKVSGNKLEVYRPEITKGSATPSKVKKLEEVKPEVKAKPNDDVYERGEKTQKITPGEKGGNTIRERKPPVQERGNKEKITPQQKTSPPVKEKGGKSAQQRNPHMEKGEKIPPQREMNPPVEERKDNIPQERNEDIQKREKINPPQETSPPVQERNLDVPKQEKMNPQPKSHPPVQERRQPPHHQPSQKKQKGAP